MTNAPFTRVNIVGTSGSGKSTVSTILAAKLGVPHIELDALFWQADWTSLDDDTFLSKLEAVLAGDGWVLDGNYSRTTPIKWKRAQAVIWLDYSFSRTLAQALKRAFGRSWSGRELWPGTGNVETFRRSFLSRDSIILWTIRTHGKNQKKYSEMMSDPEYAHIEFIRLRSPSETRRFIEAL